MTYEDSYLVLQNNSLDLIIPVNSNPSRKIAVKLERLREEPHGVLRFVASNLKNIELEFRFVSIPDLPTLLESDVGNSINPDKETEHVFISNSHAGQQEMKINLGRPTVCPTGLEFLCAVTTLRRIPFESFSSDVQCIRALNGSLVTRIRVETGGTPVGMLKFTDAQQWLCNSNDVSITKADVYIWQNLLDEPEVHIQFFMNR
jgi:hypothetical protein